MNTHRARPFPVHIRKYVEGGRMADGYAGITLSDLARGVYIVASDADGWELTTENHPLEKLKEKIAWTPGLSLVPFIYARGARHLILGDAWLVRFPGGLELPFGANEVTEMFEEIPAKEKVDGA